MDSDTADTTDMVHNIIIMRRRGGHAKLNSTLICIFLQPIRLARQAGHRSLLQTTFEAKSSKKKAFNLKSKDDIIDAHGVKVLVDPKAVFFIVGTVMNYEVDYLM